MRLRDIYRSQAFGLSVEVFPPKTEAGDASLWETLDQLTPWLPAFVSCTYGAGGTTRNRTVEICRTVQTRWNTPATAHFTCVGSTRDELTNWLDYAYREGIRNIMALRGDPPQGSAAFTTTAGGLTHATELVRLIRTRFPDLGIGVAGYPEKHPEAPDLQTDIDHLRAKVDAGADAVFTQLFFDNDSFFRFRDRCVKAGISVPIVPGIMPITEFARIQRITSMCGAAMPPTLATRLEAARDDLDGQFDIGVEHAVRQSRDLIAQGVPGIHFYVLNKSRACEQILQVISPVRPERKPS